MENLYEVDENYYYVYEHWLDNELIYIGKGKRDRAFSIKRNQHWLKRVSDSDKTVEVLIRGYFAIESDAFKFERILIKEYIDKGASLTNIVHNDELYRTIKDIYKNEEFNDLTPTKESFVNIVESKGIFSCLINHVSQIRPHLKARMKSFNSQGVKGLAFSKFISGQEEIAKISEEEGLTPLVLWNVHSNDKQMSSHQIEMRDILIRTRLIPEPYNLLVLNSSMQENWGIDDESVRFAIINATNENERIQSLDRIKKDIDVLIYKTHEKIEQVKVEVPDSFLNVTLTPYEKEKLCEALDLRDSNGRTRKWPTVQTILEDEGYEVENKQVSIDRKRIRVSIITKIDENSADEAI